MYVQTQAEEGGWGTTRQWDIGPQEEESCEFFFGIRGDVENDTYVRLRFYNPPSSDPSEYGKYKDEYSLEKKFFGKDLERRRSDSGLTESVSAELADSIIHRFEQIQDLLRNREYDTAWSAFTKRAQDVGFHGRFDSFKSRMKSTTNPWGWSKTGFVNLVPGKVVKQGGIPILKAALDSETWTISFEKEGSEWKIRAVEDYTEGEWGGDWQERVLPTMEKRLTAHFEIYYAKDTLAEKDIERIVEDREAGYQEICQVLGIESKTQNQPIRLVFFDDASTKQMETGHQGAGWAFGRTMVELYNDETKLDPYHETTHVLAHGLGSPPALFIEGLATYMSERLGAAPLRNLSGGQASLYARVRDLKTKGDWIPLEELITYSEIGSSKSRAPVSYAEAGAFVKFLVDNYGTEKFLEAYKSLKNPQSRGKHPTRNEENVKKLEGIYGKSLDALRKEWHECFMEDATGG